MGKIGEGMKSSLDQASKYADRLMGKKAKHYSEPEWSFNPATGSQALSTQPKDVVVRPWPIGFKEKVDMSNAGITEVDAKWAMRVKYGRVEPGDLLTVAGLNYIVVEGGVTTDEHDVDQIILTKRRR